MKETLEVCKKNSYNYALLPVLHDVDEEKDLIHLEKAKCMKEQELIFVYNANSDLFSTVTDFAHKLLSPSTYNCNLCALTYGNFTIKQEWKSFIEELAIKTVFLHKDEFEKQYKIQAASTSNFY